MSVRGGGGIGEPIAVLGMGVRFPGAADTGEFWALLRDGIDAITVVPAARFDVGALSTRWGGFIDGIDLFDAGFFGISPREASRMDPQQRLALVAAWEALEDGGQPPMAVRGTETGVFVGVHRDEY